ncbi:hypothetical protein EVAR_26011_1 [Eumeta japonica]|uniref:Uncharacterized protein n=1 Tax=Eumeta variegata TaxID=151549 RepID=A0A4C1VQK4_EUMVA|nr:hypothetical protein EVAR_26011_1 [Eumeta japonica]
MPNFKILGRLEVPFSFIPPRVPEKKGLDRRTDGRTDGQQSDPIRVPFFPFERVRRKLLPLRKSQPSQARAARWRSKCLYKEPGLSSRPAACADTADAAVALDALVTCAKPGERAWRPYEWKRSAPLPHSFVNEALRGAAARAERRARSVAPASDVSTLGSAGGRKPDSRCSRGPSGKRHLDYTTRSALDTASSEPIVVIMRVAPFPVRGCPATSFNKNVIHQRSGRGPTRRILSRHARCPLCRRCPAEINSSRNAHRARPHFRRASNPLPLRLLLETSMPSHSVGSNAPTACFTLTSRAGYKSDFTCESAAPPETGVDCGDRCREIMNRKSRKWNRR